MTKKFEEQLLEQLERINVSLGLIASAAGKQGMRNMALEGRSERPRVHVGTGRGIPVGQEPDHGHQTRTG